MKICIFGYNFTHKKTYEGIMHLLSRGIRINHVLLMNKVKINSPKSIISIGPKDMNYTNPKLICKNFNIPLNIFTFNSSKCIKFLNKKKFDLGIILGARILNQNVINQFRIGILNAHPGLIPENRGLDTYQWAVLNTIPQGVTTHLIDRKMDMGKIIEKKKIKIYRDDAFLDLYLRVQSLELEMIVEAIGKLKKNPKYGKNVSKIGSYNTFMKIDKQRDVLKKFQRYKNKFNKN